jgi:hypothetical protein
MRNIIHPGRASPVISFRLPGWHLPFFWLFHRITGFMCIIANICIFFLIEKKILKTFDLFLLHSACEPSHISDSSVVVIFKNFYRAPSIDNGRIIGSKILLWTIIFFCESICLVRGRVNSHNNFRPRLSRNFLNRPLWLSSIKFFLSKSFKRRIAYIELIMLINIVTIIISGPTICNRKYNEFHRPTTTGIAVINFSKLLARGHCETVSMLPLHEVDYWC